MSFPKLFFFPIFIANIYEVTFFHCSLKIYRIRFVPENGKSIIPNFSETLHPYFPSIVENVTVSHGRKAVLKCEVDNLRNYKVSFLTKGFTMYCSQFQKLTTFVILLKF